jgi:hypothetical protein
MSAPKAAAAAAKLILQTNKSISPYDMASAAAALAVYTHTEETILANKNDPQTPALLAALGQQALERAIVADSSSGDEAPHVAANFARLAGRHADAHVLSWEMRQMLHNHSKNAPTTVSAALEGALGSNKPKGLRARECMLLNEEENPFVGYTLRQDAFFPVGSETLMSEYVEPLFPQARFYGDRVGPFGRAWVELASISPARQAASPIWRAANEWLVDRAKLPKLGDCIAAARAQKAALTIS